MKYNVHVVSAAGNEGDFIGIEIPQPGIPDVASYFDRLQAMGIRPVSAEPTIVGFNAPDAQGITDLDIQPLPAPALAPAIAAGAVATRFLMVKSDGSVESGASYAGCSPDHPELCDPRHFKNIGDALAHAQQAGETPVTVASAEDAFRIIQSEAQSGGGLSLTTLAIGAGLLYLIFGRKKSAS